MKIKTWGGIIVCFIFIMGHSLMAAADRVDYYLSETLLDKALLRVGRDFHLTIIFQTNEVKGLKSKPFTSRKNIRQVLTELLAPHPFDYKFINNDTLVIFRVDNKTVVVIPEQDKKIVSKLFKDDHPEEGLIEEIVISSRRWNSSLQTSPASVTLVSRDQLSAPDVGNVDRLTFQTSNVTFDYTSTLSGSSNSLVSFIRGVGQSDFAISTDPAIGVYLDGIYLSRSIGSVIDLAEYDRVEIYKGPHGNLFSRNAIGGTINITSRRPGRDLHIKGQLTTGSRNRRDVLIDLDIPLISDRIYGNFFFSSRNRKGYGTRLEYDGQTAADLTSITSFHPDLSASTELGNQNVERFHGKIIWETEKNLEMSLVSDAIWSRELAPVSTLLGFSDNLIGPGNDTIGEFYNHCLSASGAAIGQEALCQGLFAANIDTGSDNDRTFFDNRFITNSPYQNYSNGPNHSNHDIYNLIGTVQWQLNDGFFLKYIAGYRHTKADLGRDGDKTPILMDHTSYLYDHKQNSHEIQLSGKINNTDIQWYGGLLYFFEKAQMNTHVIIGGLPLMDLRATEHSKNISYNYFAHANIPISTNFSFTGGFHYASEEKNLQLDFHELELFAVRLGVPLSQFPDPEDLTLLRPLTPDQSKLNNFLPRFSFEYDHDNFFAYFSAAKSTKPGGVNYRAVLPETKISSFGPERAWSFEGGIKTRNPALNSQVNLAVFHMDYKNLQLVSQHDVTPEIENAGNASLWGMEIEAQVKLWGKMNLNASLGYIHTRYTELLETSRIKANYRFQKTPTWTFSLSADYPISLNEGISLLWRGNYNFRSETYNNAENTELLRQAPIHLIDSSLTANIDDTGWMITFGVNNLLNEKYIVSGFNQPGVGFTEATFSRPRHWYLALTVQK